MAIMMLALGLLIFCASVIYVSCELFVNAVEWLGHALKMGTTAVGTVLAAFGTALPETVVTLMAVLLGDDSQERDIGVGAAMGGPLVLATLAYGIVGLSIVRRGGRRALHKPLDADSKHLSLDGWTFVAIYGAKVALGALSFALKPYCAMLFVGAYALFLWRELGRNEPTARQEELEPLRFAPKMATPPVALVLLQVLISVAIIGWAADLFVEQLTALGRMGHMRPHVVALVLSPVATELPEILNAMIWVRQGKERLALANISGSMMIQATLPSALGIGFTPWLFDGPLWASAAVTVGAMLLTLSALAQGKFTPMRLLFSLPLYLVFAAYLLMSQHLF